MSKPKESIEKAALRVALGSYLAYYKADADPDDVLQALYDDELKKFEISLWHPFENDTPAYVADTVCSLYDDIVTLVEKYSLEKK